MSPQPHVDISDSAKADLRNIKAKLEKAVGEVNRRMETRDALQARLDGIDAEIDAAADSEIEGKGVGKLDELQLLRATLPERIASADRLIDRKQALIPPIIELARTAMGEAATPLQGKCADWVRGQLESFFEPAEAANLANASEPCRRMSWIGYIRLSTSDPILSQAADAMKRIDALLNGPFLIVRKNEKN